MSRILRNMWRDDKGQDLVEYALLVVLLATVCVAAVQGAGLAIGKVFTDMKVTLSPA